MSELSLPIPAAFVLGTGFCADPPLRAMAAQPDTWSDAMRQLEVATGLGFGNARGPLLLSVRSGAPVSMPGMMETLLNVGLCDATVDGLLRRTGNPRLVWDAYRRLVATYGEVVAHLPSALFDDALKALANGRGERELDFQELRTLTRQYQAIYERATERPFPQEPADQLAGAIEAVLASWQSEKACDYRRRNGIADQVGTAVTIQSMVFGNAGGQSGAGVGFTRDPVTGEAGLWIDFLFNAQGEDVVSGRRSAHGHRELQAVLPAVWTALQDVAQQIEHTFADMQDFEFTVQDGQLFMLQTRDGKRTRLATVRIALDLLDEGLIGVEMALERTAGLDRESLARTRIRDDSNHTPQALARAIVASGGVAIGEIALDDAGAAARRANGSTVVLVRRDAETNDIAALDSATGLLTARGARTSHAAVVARQMDKVCLVGCASLAIDDAARVVRFDDATLREGEMITLDGNDGIVYRGALRTEIDYPTQLLERLESLRQRERAPAPAADVQEGDAVVQESA